LKYDAENLYDIEYDKDAKEDDEKKKSKRERKLEEKLKRKEIIDKRKMQRVLSNCRLCLGNNHIFEEQILSFAKSTIMILPEQKIYPYGHFNIVPVEHVGSLIELEDEVRIILFFLCLGI